jgi:hypothetical protein
MQPHDTSVVQRDAFDPNQIAMLAEWAMHSRHFDNEGVFPRLMHFASGPGKTSLQNRVHE